MQNQPTPRLTAQQKIAQAYAKYESNEQDISRVRKRAGRKDPVPFTLLNPAHNYDPEPRGGQYNNHHHRPSGLYKGLWD